MPGSLRTSYVNQYFSSQSPKTMIKNYSVMMLSMLCVTIANSSIAMAGIISFSQVQLANIASPAGQNFSYTVGPDNGILNVRLISGAVSNIQAGSSPDTNGLFILQNSANLTPAKLQFTFDSSVSFTIRENETLTARESNAFTLASGSWTVNSFSNASVSTGPSSVTFIGASNLAPFGDYSISANSNSFVFDIVNTSGIPEYGSAISLEVTAVPEPSSCLCLIVSASAFACFKRTRRAVLA